MRRASTVLAVGLSFAAASLVGCGDARPLAAGGSQGTSCATCHGDSSRQPTTANPYLPAAPPVGTRGETATTDRAVGAHQLHLNDGDLSRAMACDECHLVPSSFGHRNGTVDMSWGPLATDNGTIGGIVWDGTTCASTYCHGNFRNGNTSNAPSWTAARANPCGTCHGSASNAAPGGTHPAVAAGSCGTCHPGYTGTTVDVALHVNGSVDVPGLSCTSCHGTAGRTSVASADPNQAAAPPVDTGGSSATSSPGVGAHLVHVNGARSLPVLCAACHAGAVPTQPVHSNGTVTVAFGGLAGTGGVTPGPYTPGSGGSCSATYCHGNFPGGNGSGASPAWTAAGTLGCAACHGNPPPLSATVHHPQNTGCTTCHPFGATTHVDGTVQKPTGCTACHGNLTLAGQTLANPSTAAPGYDAGSVDSTGQGATTAPGVGAHAAHLRNTTLRSAPIACSECHQLPPSNADVGHATGAGTGGARATLTWGSLARTAWSGPAVTPAYAGSTSGANGSTAGSCASSYCHGNFPNGNTGNAPSWSSGAAAAACGSCHGTPPGGTHPANSACGSCHGAGYSWNGTTGTVDKSLHMNGVLEVAGLSCTSCHGTGGRTSVANADPNQAAAPPVDTGGSSATSSPGVGAHLVHVNGATSRPVLCAACHAGAVPTQPVHSNGTVTVAFGGLATTGGVTPGSYTPGSGGSCSATYCHGNFPGGNGTGASPTWITAGTLGCTACHGSPPPLSATVHHPRNTGCATCHPLGAATHVDGTVQRPTGCTACHGNLTLTGQTLANANPSAPGYDAGSVDSTGQSAVAAPGVGAHSAHLKGTTLRSAPIACAECHQLPPSNADVGHATGAGTGGARATLTWGSLARGAVDAWSGAAVTPAYAGSTSGAYGSTPGSCASSYCHGNFRNGATGNAPTWTAGAAAAACGTCHGTPPGGTHPANSDCGSCHGPGYSWNGTSGTVDKSLHMNGVLDGGGEPTAGGSSCGGCHAAIFAAMTSGSPPAGSTRHFLGGGDNPVDPGGTWTGNLKSSPLYATASCVSMCHGDHPHDIGTGTTHQWNVYLDANARSATRTTATRDDTDFDAAQASGGLCTSCHQNPVDAGHPLVAPAAFGASAHDYDSNTVGANTYAWIYTLHDGGTFRRNCTKCHADRNDGRPGDSTTPFGAVHSAANQSLLAGTTNPANAPATFVCYNCHGNGTTGTNLSGKDIASQIVHATTTGQSGHPANSDSVHNSVTEFNNAAFGNTLGVTGRHASCLDCHDPHEARSGTHAATTNLAGPPLQGAWGAQLSSNPAFWTAPAAGNFTKKTIAAGTDFEATLCFKCHSSYYGALPTSPSGGFTETDTAREFNPANVGNFAGTWASGETAGGFHPVLASAANNLGATGNVVSPWSRTSLMTCSDCHESDSTADPNGPHGSSARFILKGPNTTWNSSVTSLGSNAWMPTGTFCLNCHGNADANGRFPEHSRGDHSVPCFNCHAAIPHGGPRPGILNAAAGAGSNGAPGQYAGYDGAAPYYQGQANNRLYIKSYPATNTTSWAQGNCGCDGTGH